MSKSNDEIRADLESCIQEMMEPDDASLRIIRAMRRAEMRIAELEVELKAEKEKYADPYAFRYLE